MSDKQYDDHIWLTVHGSSWAIRAIHRNIFYLWRGYMHDGTLERASIDVSSIDWNQYATAARAALETKP